MKTKFKTILFFSFILVINCSNSWNFNKGGADWPDSCKGDNQSPIDISQPFEYRELNITFNYDNMMTEYSFYNDGNNLLLEGDFGYLTYNDKIYFSSQIVFYSSSMHTFGNKRLPLEMQVIHRDEEGNNVIVVIMFRYTKDDYSALLGKLGFDDSGLMTQAPFETKSITEDINLGKYVSEEKDFFIYEGKESSPPCKSDSTYLILADVLKVSAKQLDNFPQMVRNKNRIVQDKGERMIYTNFKINEIEEKKKEADERMKEIELEKKAFEKAEMIEEKLEEGEEIKEKDEKKKDKKDDKQKESKDDKLEENKNIKDNKENKDNKSDVKVDKDDEKKNDNKQDADDNNNKINQPCNNSNIIPFDDVLDKVKAYAENIRINDPKFFEGSSETDIVKDLPDTEAMEQSKKLEDQYSEWMKLFKESKEKDIKPKSFLQMKMLEKSLKDAKFQPFIDSKLGFTSFLQISNEKCEEKSNDIPMIIPPNYIIVNQGPKINEEAFEHELIEKFNRLSNLVKTEDCVNRQLTDKVKALSELVNNSTVGSNQPIAVLDKVDIQAEENNKTQINAINVDEPNINEVSHIVENVATENQESTKIEDTKIESQPIAEVPYVPPVITTPPQEPKIYKPAVDINKLKTDYQNYKNLRSYKNNQQAVIQPDLITENQITLDKLSEEEKVDNEVITNEDSVDNYLNLRDSLNSISEDLTPEEMQDDNFLATTETSALLEINNSIIQIESTTDDKINENINNFEKLKGFADVLDKSYEVKKENLVNKDLISDNQISENNTPVQIKSSANLFTPNFDASVYNLFKSTIEELHNDYNELDQINKDNAEVLKLCDEKGNIKMTIQNLGKAISETYKVVKIETTEENKIDKLANSITDLVILQEDDSTTEAVTDEDIDEIIKSVSDTNEKPDDLKQLIFTILKDFPIKLLKHANEEKDEILENPNKTVFGPNSQTNDIEGEGRKAVSESGVVENVDIFNISSWPNSCK
jgi:carbonic anhydrase